MEQAIWNMEVYMKLVLLDATSPWLPHVTHLYKSIMLIMFIYLITCLMVGNASVHHRMSTGQESSDHNKRFLCWLKSHFWKLAITDNDLQVHV